MPVRRLVILLALLLAAPAAAEARSVPQGFYGVMWDGAVVNAAAGVQDTQWDLMASSGVESARTVFKWSEAQREPGAAFDFSESDPIVRRAAERRIDLLPVVEYAPRWARAFPSRDTSPPRSNAQYGAYLDALVRRYGPKGSFWTQNPAVPRRPLRQWQIWNEPHLRTYWDAPARSRYGSPRGYGRLLKVAHRTIKRADRGAKVVLAGLTQRAWDELALLYRRGGIRRYFDIATLQIFPQTAERSVEAARRFRAAMNRAGDRRKPIYLTEITWPASRGRTKGIRFQRQETPAGMARRLTQAYTLLARARRRLGIRKVFWYTWASPYGRGGSIFNYAGLFRYEQSDGSFTEQPAFASYRRMARRHEGCAKNERGACR